MKILKIHSCIQCPNIIKDGSTNQTLGLCGVKNDEDGLPKEIISYIPDWCPLEDVINESEKTLLESGD
jgi:hypothetical protein